MSNFVRVIEARSDPEIVESLARALWAKDNPGKDCPPDRIPTTETLAAWLPEFPEAAHLEAGERLAVLYGLSDGGGCRWRLGRTATLNPPSEWSLTLLAWERPSPGRPGWGSMGKLFEVHVVWLDQPAEHRPKHPLAPLVQAWQRRPRPSEPFKPVNRASLPQLHRITAPEGERLQAAELPAIYGGGTEPPELWRPGMEPEIPGCPSWLLALFEQAGGVSSRQGRGAPWPMHIFIAAFLHLNIGDRNGEWRQLRFSREYVESWLHPDGWDKDNRRKHWHRFPEALHAVDRLRVYVPGVGDVRLVGVDTIPQKPTDALVDIRVRIPKTAAHGARIDWPTLCKYRRASSPLYRAYLSVVALMDRTAHKGAPITRQIGTTILKADGTPKRKHGGRIVRDNETLIVHPQAGMVQALSDADLARLIGLDPNKRDNPGRARGAFEQLEADGIFEGEWTKDGKLRAFGPKGEV